MILPSRIPGVVKSVDRDAREVRVDIPGLTDGSDIYPLASIEYPIGDNSANTEIRINVGDLVWLAFENGDQRYPIITGFRNPRTGNEVGWRRFNHDNIEFNADDQLHVACQHLVIDAATSVVINTPQATVNAPKVDVTANTELTVTCPVSTFNGNLQVNGGLNVAPGTGGAGGGITAAGQIRTTAGGIQADAGDIVATAGDVKAGDITLKTHHTSGVQTGTGTSGDPVPP